MRLRGWAGSRRKPWGGWSPRAGWCWEGSWRGGGPKRGHAKEGRNPQSGLWLFQWKQKAAGWGLSVVKTPLPLQGAPGPSLVGEPTPHVPHITGERYEGGSSRCSSNAWAQVTCTSQVNWEQKAKLGGPHPPVFSMSPNRYRKILMRFVKINITNLIMDGNQHWRP